MKKNFKDKAIDYIDYLITFCDLSIKAIEKYRSGDIELIDDINKIREDLILAIDKSNTEDDVQMLNKLSERVDKIQSNLRFSGFNNSEEIDRYIKDILHYQDNLRSNN